LDVRANKPQEQTQGRQVHVTEIQGVHTRQKPQQIREQIELVTPETLKTEIVSAYPKATRGGCIIQPQQTALYPSPPGSFADYGTRVPAHLLNASNLGKLRE
jgi:hypothetical protein